MRLYDPEPKERIDDFDVNVINDAPYYENAFSGYSPISIHIKST